MDSHLIKSTTLVKNAPYDTIIKFCEMYGIFIVLASAFTLLSPDLSPKGYLMDRDLESEGAKASGSSIIKQLIWLGLFCIYSLSIIRELDQKKQSEKWHLILIPILSVAMLMTTIIWSDYRSLTIKRSLFQLILVFVVFCSVYFSIKHRTFDKCVRLIALSMILITLLGLAKGSAYRGIELVSWASTKNVFGSIMLAYLFVYFCLNKSRIDTPILIILSIFIILSISKTSIALFFFILILNKCHVAISKNIFITLSYLILIPFIIAPFFMALLGIIWFPAMTAEPEFMTGRGLIWQILYNDILNSNKLFIGHGYGAYFNTGTPPDPFNIKNSFLALLNQSHNSYLDLILQIGFPLTIVLMISICSMVRRIESKQLYIAGIVLLFYGVNEAAILRDQNHVWTAFLVVLSWSLVQNNSKGGINESCRCA